MKEQIYTIPVTHRFLEGGECPFCNMLNSLEEESVEYILGPAYMTDTIRLETDKIGFCEEHIKRMYEKQNRLGVALMLYTHLREINLGLNKEISSLSFDKPKKKLFGKSKETKNPVSSYLNNITNSCFVCNRINNTFERYTDTFFYMWQSRPETKEMVESSKGFCVKHFSMLIEKGGEKLTNESYRDFFETVSSIQMKNLKRLEEEIEWFINKFDYRYKDEPLKTSKDALIRALKKINSADTNGTE